MARPKRDVRMRWSSLLAVFLLAACEAPAPPSGQVPSEKLPSSQLATGNATATATGLAFPTPAPPSTPLAVKPLDPGASPTSTPSPLSPVPPTPSSSPAPTASLPPAPARPSLAQAITPTTDPPRLVAPGAPRATASKAGVAYAVWVPQRRFAPGEWIPIHARITNTTAQRIELPCDFLVPWIDASSVFDRGRSWTGQAAAFKSRLIGEASWLVSTGLRYMSKGELGCGGDMAYPIWLPAATTWDFDYAAMPSYLPGSQPLPAGTVSLDMTLVMGPNSGPSKHIALRVPIDLGGFDVFPYPSLAQLADDALATPGFLDWLDSRDAPRLWDNTFADVNSGSIDWTRFGWQVPMPQDVLQVGLFADGPTDGTVSGQVFLDPFTGYSYGFWSRCSNSRTPDYTAFPPGGCP